MGMPEIIRDPGGAFPSGLHLVSGPVFEAATAFCELTDTPDELALAQPSSRLALATSRCPLTR